MGADEATRVEHAPPAQHRPAARSHGRASHAHDRGTTEPERHPGRAGQAQLHQPEHTPPAPQRPDSDARHAGWYALAGEERPPPMRAETIAELPQAEPERVDEDAASVYGAIILFAIAAGHLAIFGAGRAEGLAGVMSFVAPVLAGLACLRSQRWGRPAIGVVALLKVATGIAHLVHAHALFDAFVAFGNLVTVIAMATVVISDDLKLQRGVTAGSVAASLLVAAAMILSDAPRTRTFEVPGLPGNLWTDASGLRVQGPPRTTLFRFDDPKFAPLRAATHGVLDLAGVKVGILVGDQLEGAIEVSRPPPGQGPEQEIGRFPGDYVRSDDLLASTDLDHAAAWSSRVGDRWILATALGDGRDLVLVLRGAPNTEARDVRVFEALARGISLPRQPAPRP